MPSDLQRVAQALVECLDQIPNMVASLQRLAARCRENASLVADSTGNPAARMAALQLDAAARACEEAAHYAAMAPPAARAWAEQMVSGARGATHPDSGSADRNRTTSGGSERSSASADDDRPAGRDPTGPAAGGEPEAREPAPFIERMFQRLPERPDDKGPTSGILTTTDGRGLIHLVSGARGPGAGSPGLTGRTAKLKVAQDHVEGHAAALMRRIGAPREATLYLNNKPCPGEAGCDETLEDQLPSGSILTLYWPGGHKVYKGNGKGMA